MAYLELNKKNLTKNYQVLKDLFNKHKVSWGVVSKLLCGNEIYLEVLVELGIREIHDSRISNLKKVKEIDPGIQTVYIKPPAKLSIKDIIDYADVSFNTEYFTLQMLSNEAVKQQKIHKVIIMIEMGDLREGIMGERLIDFYSSVFDLPNIEVVGIGANLNCLHGIMPSHDKLVQLSLYKQLIDATFVKKIPWVSGGTSVVLPMLFKNHLPAGINHFRIGETLFFGANIVDNDVFEGMNNDVLKLHAEIIELNEKPLVPVGELAENPSGELMEIDESLYGQVAYRAIIDVGLLDISPDFLIPTDDKIKVTGASSDMLVLDLGPSSPHYKVGDIVTFKLKYMGALGLMNSDYIEKKIV